MYLPHTLDVYAPGTGGTETPVQAGVRGYFEPVSAEKRVWMQSVSKKPMRILWLAVSARETVTDGRRIFWRDDGSWWNVRGAPQVFDRTGGAHIEALVIAETADGLFSEETGISPGPPPVVP